MGADCIDGRECRLPKPPRAENLRDYIRFQTMTQPEIKVVPDPAGIAEEAAARIIHAAEEAIALTDRFTIALSGGSTPKLLHELLATKYKDAIEWSRVEIFF